jgi:hypothetical protein
MVGHRPFGATNQEEDTMAKINKGSERIGEIAHRNGTRVEFFTSANRNTGEWIVWQRHNGHVTRHTGRNIGKLLDELNDALNEGTVQWLECNSKVLDALTQQIRTDPSRAERYN